MLYALHEAAYNAATPLRLVAACGAGLLGFAAEPGERLEAGPHALCLGATCSPTSPAATAARPGASTASTSRQRRSQVREDEVWSIALGEAAPVLAATPPTCAAPRAPLGAPPLLIVAPLSGHYATLLRGTVQTFLQDHEVYVTDWSNARDVPMLDGRFDFHDYIDHVTRDAARTSASAPHVVAVCQPGPPVLAAAALMAEDGEPARPGQHDLHGLADRRAARRPPRPTGWPRSGRSPGSSRR